MQRAAQQAAEAECQHYTAPLESLVSPLLCALQAICKVRAGDGAYRSADHGSRPAWLPCWTYLCLAPRLMPKRPMAGQAAGAADQHIVAAGAAGQRFVAAWPAHARPAAHGAHTVRARPRMQYMGWGLQLCARSHWKCGARDKPPVPGTFTAQRTAIPPCWARVLCRPRSL